MTQTPALDGDKLVDLAERCEAAMAEQQAELLREAFALVFGPERSETRPGIWRWNSRWLRPRGMLSAYAFESAAMTLVDERALWATGSMEDGPFARLCWPMPDGSFLNGYFESKAATPALALCAAALKARARSASTSSQGDEG